MTASATPVAKPKRTAWKIARVNPKRDVIRQLVRDTKKAQNPPDVVLPKTARNRDVAIHDAQCIMGNVQRIISPFSIP